MKIEITLTESEKEGIINYLKEVDEITDQSTQEGIKFAIEMEVRNRFYHAIRDQREAISTHISDAEDYVKNWNKITSPIRKSVNLPHYGRK